MSKSKQYRSRVMASVHETAEGLTAAGVMSKQTMREGTRGEPAGGQ
jgi:putative transcriptional regulator